MEIRQQNRLTLGELGTLGRYYIQFSSIFYLFKVSPPVTCYKYEVYFNLFSKMS